MIMIIKSSKMLVKVYPVVFVVLANVLKASCDGTSSLTFIIDDTMSMGPEIQQVKDSVNRILNVVLRAKASVIRNMVLVTVNDPVVKVRAVTNSSREFNETLAKVDVWNATPGLKPDWAEMVLEGILKGLEQSLPGSFIYVFTDASTKELIKKKYVIQLCQTKQSQIIFVLTAPYKYINDDIGYQVYYDVAAACSGIIYVAPDKNITSLLRTITSDVEGNQAVLASQTAPPNIQTSMKFTIDNHRYAVIKATGSNIELNIKKDKGNHAMLIPVVMEQNNKIIKVENATSGDYFAVVKADSTASVFITGETDIRFEHGFSKLPPTTLTATSKQIIAGTKTHLSVLVTDPGHALKITHVNLLKKDEKTIIKRLSLKKTGTDLYTTELFIAPKETFKISVFGTMISTGHIINRLGKIPVTPTVLPDKSKPLVNIEQGTTIEVEYNRSVELNCKVTAYPEPVIRWYDDKKALSSDNSNGDVLYQYKSKIQIVNVKKNERYHCIARNSEGSVRKSIEVVAKSPFIVKSVPSGITEVAYGTNRIIKCEISSLLPMKIHWYFGDETKGIYREIYPSNKYGISHNDTLLEIKNMDSSLVGRYTCSASLLNDPNVAKISSTRVNIIGLVPPKVVGSGFSQSTVFNSTEDDDELTIPCSATGTPKPDITWKVGGRVITSNAKYAIENGALVIKHPQVSDSSDSYECVATNEAGTTNATFPVQVYQKPKLIGIEHNIIKAVVGNPTEITCSASKGHPKPKITWYFAEKVVGSGDVYHIPKVEVKHAGTYKCVAENVAGSDHHDTQLTVQVPPKIDQVASRLSREFNSTDEDDRLIIPCSATGHPKPDITWKVGGRLITPNAKYSIVNGALVISHPQVSDSSDSYECVATNEAGTVSAKFSARIYQKPKIIGGVHSSIKAVAGEPTEITCSASKGYPKPKITWYFAEKVVGTGDVFHIPTVQEKHAGTYKCVAENVAGSDHHDTQLTVLVLPKVNQDASHSSRVFNSTDEDDHLKIPCSATGTPKPNITWKVAGRLITSNAKYSIEDGALVIQHPQVSDSSDSYECVATNEAGTANSTFSAQVYQKPKVIGDKHNSIALAEVGKPTQFTCTASKGYPKPQITWYFKSKLVGTGDVYHISKVEETHAGTYKCVAENIAGSDQQDTLLTVQDKPKLAGGDHNNIKTVVGQPIRITCSAIKGYPKPRITWYFMDKLVGTGDVYDIPMVEEKHAGTYKCVAENVVGSDQHDILLTVQVPPKMEQDSLTTSSVLNSTDEDDHLKIPCTASGTPKPDITWKVDGRLITPNAKYSIVDGALVINHPQVSDSSDSYKCVATNEAGTVSSTFTARVYQKPKLIGNENNNIKAVVGKPIEICCSASKGYPKPEITWYTKGKQVGTGDVYRIPRVEVYHAGTYKCVAENVAGSDHHDTLLIVQVPPKMDKDGISKISVFNCTEGDDHLQIPCSATGTPKPEIIWTLEGRRITPNAKYSIVDGALVIKHPQVSDSSDSYKCVATNEAGSISSTFEARVYQKPKIIGNDHNNMKAVVGKPTEITCSANKGYPKPKITWYFMGKEVGTGDVYRIPRVEVYHAGTYKCVAENVAGSDHHDTLLTVQVPPTMEHDGIAKSNVLNCIEGDDHLKIPCSAAGTPKPEIQWKLGRRLITTNLKYSIVDGALVISHPQVSDSSDSYECVATNEAGSVSTSFTVRVDQKPKLEGQGNVAAILGKPVQMTCSASKGSPKPKVTWYFMDKQVGTGEVYQLPRVEEKDAGIYKCVAENVAGRDIHDTLLIVQFGARIIENVTEYEAIEEDATLRIPCRVVGIPKPDVSWTQDLRYITELKDTFFVEDDGTLTIKNITKVHIGNYTCHASNFLGSAHFTSSVNVLSEPENEGQVHHVDLSKGQNEIIECGSYYDPATQSVRWFLDVPRLGQGIFGYTPGHDYTDCENTERPYVDTSTPGWDSSEFMSTTERNRPLHRCLVKMDWQLVNITDATDKYNGRYTCRVSDARGGRTETYVVTVGGPPSFINPNVESLTEWEGNEELKLDCSVDGSPRPTVTWTFNGKSLPTERSFTLDASSKWGQYTCNVSNVHGWKQRSFEVVSSVCILNKKSIYQNMENLPLILSPTEGWPTFYVQKDFMILDNEEEIIFSCPKDNDPNGTNGFFKFPSRNEIKAHCDKQDIYIIGEESYKLSDLQCINEIQPIISRNNIKCCTDNSEMIQVGFNLNGDSAFLEAYKVCFDHSISMPLYSRARVFHRNGVVAHSWQNHNELEAGKGEEAYTCETLNSTCCYGKTQLVNGNDFEHNAAQNSAFIYPLNAVPGWRRCDSKTSWENIEDSVAAKSNEYDTTVSWSGVHRLQHIKGSIIPRYLWKVVQFDENPITIAIVYVNVPSPTKDDILCKRNICNTEEYEWTEFEEPYVYCCQFEDFLEAFNLEETLFEYEKLGDDE